MKPKPGDMFEIYIGEALCAFVCDHWEGPLCVAKSGHAFRWYQPTGFLL